MNFNTNNILSQHAAFDFTHNQYNQCLFFFFFNKSTMSVLSCKKKMYSFKILTSGAIKSDLACGTMIHFHIRPENPTSKQHEKLMYRWSACRTCFQVRFLATVSVVIPLKKYDIHLCFTEYICFARQRCISGHDLQDAHSTCS